METVEVAANRLESLTGFQDKEGLRAALYDAEPLLPGVNLEPLRERLAYPFRLGVLGQFRSGKSSLINALVGETVALVDEEEATPTLSRYFAAEAGGDGRARILYWDGGEETGTIAEILRRTREGRPNRAWLDRIERIEYGHPSSFLRMLELWDTPGLGGSDANQRISEAFATQVDGAVWVFDADSVGRADIVGPMEALARYGVPTLAVLNKAEDLDQADVDRAADFIHRVYPRASFLEIIPFCARKALDPSSRAGYGDAVPADGGLSNLLAAMDRHLVGPGQRISQASLARDLLAALDTTVDRLRAEAANCRGRAHAFSSVLREVEKRLAAQYVEIERLIVQGYHPILSEGLLESLEAAFRTATPEDLSNPERYRRLRDLATNGNIALPILERFTEGLAADLHARVTGFALNVEDAVLATLSVPEKMALWAGSEAAEGESRLLETAKEHRSFGSKFALTQWDILVPRPQWDYVLGDIRPFRRPTRPPGTGPSPGMAVGSVDDLSGKPELQAERSLKVYMGEAEVSFEDEIQLSVRRSRELAVGVFHERLSTALLEGRDPKALLAEASTISAQADEVGSLAARVEAFVVETGEPSIGERVRIPAGLLKAANEWWLGMAGRPTRVLSLLDPDLSHRALSRLLEFDPLVPIRIVTWAEPLSASLCTAFNSELERLRDSRTGSVSVFVPVPEPGRPAMEAKRILGLSSGTYELSTSLATVLAASEDCTIVPGESLAEFERIWRGETPGYRLLAL